MMNARIAACWRSLLYTDTKVMLEATMREHGSDDMKQILADCIAASDILDLEGYVRATADRTRRRVGSRYP